ncbi:glycosyltransferase [Caldilinea sp.]|uniref:glycosyltransferase n=1 Tax=Caldilinea sp. TaxID=2293560 RepID=UPI002605F802|nr:glycosyltransferase [Caldilinea sp.]
MIFYHPAPLSNAPQSGSQVRPIKMMEAFSSLGYDIYEITGALPQRLEKISRLMKDLSPTSYSQYLFFYGESTTAPPIVRDKTLLIGQAIKELSIFRELRARKIPLGLFYRDVHWKFDQYRNNVQWYKWLISYPLYYYELYLYARYLDYLFLPSINMLKVLPFFRDETCVIGLPAGCQLLNADSLYRNLQQYSAPKTLHLLYVGGIVPPLYDIRPVLQTVHKSPNLRLTISCRKQEWTSWRNAYETLLTSNISIVHAHETELESLYGQSDISLLFYPPHEYRSLTIPLKLFESLGHGVPVIVSSNTEAARFVQAEHIGWVVDSTEELRHLLNYLADHPSELKKMRDNVLQVREKHTWQQRAKQAADLLLQVRKDSISS